LQTVAEFSRSGRIQRRVTDWQMAIVTLSENEGRIL